MTDKYDFINNVLYINLYTLSKDNKKLYIKKFNPFDKGHLALIKTAHVLHSIVGIECYIDCNILEYLYFKIRYKYKFIHFMTSSEKRPGFSADEILHHICDANELTYDVWKNLYDFYYKKGKNKK